MQLATEPFNGLILGEQFRFFPVLDGGVPVAIRANSSPRSEVVGQLLEIEVQGETENGRNRRQAVIRKVQTIRTEGVGMPPRNGRDPVPARWVNFLQYRKPEDKSKHNNGAPHIIEIPQEERADTNGVDRMMQTPNGSRDRYRWKKGWDYATGKDVLDARKRAAENLEEHKRKMAARQPEAMGIAVGQQIAAAMAANSNSSKGRGGGSGG